ncbi:MAG TPA: A24 family peptidase [Aeromicrobium sp.]|nr:A24 family peptidase [Aeromicrobium sp.]
MAIGGWILAAMAAGMLGWLGRPVMVLLPESPDAAPYAPSPIAISRVRHLEWWLAAAAAGMVTALFFALPIHLMPAWILVCGVGTWLAYIDWHTKVLPTRIVVPLFAVTLVLVTAEAWIVSDSRILLRALAASALAYGSFWALWWFAERRRSGSFGFGDVRFAAPLGLVLGSVSPWAAPVGLYLGFVVGAALGLWLRARGQREGFAFGPAMMAGAVIGAVICA